jgi:hypothetical protein
MSANMLRADPPRARPAQHGAFADDQFVASQRDQRRIGARLGPHKGHGPDLARIQTGQVRCQPQAVCRGTARAIDDHADKIGFFALILVAQTPLQPTDRVRLDLAPRPLATLAAPAPASDPPAASPEPAAGPSPIPNGCAPRDWRNQIPDAIRVPLNSAISPEGTIRATSLTVTCFFTSSSSSSRAYLTPPSSVCTRWTVRLASNIPKTTGRGSCGAAVRFHGTHCGACRR